MALRSERIPPRRRVRTPILNSFGRPSRDGELGKTRSTRRSRRAAVADVGSGDHRGARRRSAGHIRGLRGDNRTTGGGVQWTNPQMTAVAYRRLGSLTEAEDAVQDTWLRVGRSGTDGVENFGGGLTTIVARVCLNLLRSRGMRSQEPFLRTRRTRTRATYPSRSARWSRGQMRTHVHRPPPLLAPLRGLQDDGACGQLLCWHGQFAIAVHSPRGVVADALLLRPCAQLHACNISQEMIRVDITGQQLMPQATSAPASAIRFRVREREHTHQRRWPRSQGEGQVPERGVHPDRMDVCHGMEAFVSMSDQ